MGEEYKKTQKQQVLLLRILEKITNKIAKEAFIQHYLGLLSFKSNVWRCILLVAEMISGSKK